MKLDETKIIYADLDPSEGVVLNLGTKNYYRLNETGQIVWRGVVEQKTPEEIAADLCASYDVTREEALRDVSEILARMKEELG